MGIMQVIFLCLGAFPGLIQILWGILAIVNAKVTIYTRNKVFGKPARWIGAVLIVGALLGIFTLQISLLVSLAVSIAVGFIALRGQKQPEIARAIRSQNIDTPQFAPQWNPSMEEEDEEFGTEPASLGEISQDVQSFPVPLQEPSPFQQQEAGMPPPPSLWGELKTPSDPAVNPGLSPLSSQPERLDRPPEMPLPPTAADDSRRLPPRGLSQGGRETIPPTESELAELRRQKGEDRLVKPGALVSNRDPINKGLNVQPGNLPPIRTPVNPPPVRDLQQIPNQPPPIVRPVSPEKIGDGQSSLKPAQPVGMPPQMVGSDVKVKRSAKLVVIRTSLQLQHEYWVDDDHFEIGRGTGNDVQLLDETVSRRHAAIRHAQGMWFIQDPSSTSGTFINGSKVHAKKLEPGDEIMIGSTIFRFEVNESR